MDRKYAFGKEDEGYARLEHFNDNFLHFDLVRMAKNNPSCDASATTSDGKCAIIEIKTRTQILVDNSYVSGLTMNNVPYTADTIYIEAHKAADMLLDNAVYGLEPLFINFLANDYVLVFNLAKLKTRPKRVQKKIYSKLYQAYENQIREELPINEAYIYKKAENNYILIKRPS